MGADWLVTNPTDPLSNAVVWVTMTHPDYRVVGFLAPVCAGALLVRHVQTPRARGILAAISAGIVLAVLALDRTGTATLAPYSGSRQEVLFDTGLAVLAVVLIALLAPQLSMLARALAAMGVLTLTIYTLQVVGDWAYFKAGGLDDNSWVILAVACGGS